MIAAMHDSARATLEVGTDLTPPGGPARLLPHRFNRHTFWCGQSGSGKTYALGVVLERLIVQTALPMVIFDPNSDFVRLGELREGVSGPDAEALAQRDIRVLRPATDGAEPLRARFTDLSPRSKAAVLRLDPVIDREEYNTLLHLTDTFTLSNFSSMVPTLLASDDPGRPRAGAPAGQPGDPRLGGLGPRGRRRDRGHRQLGPTRPCSISAASARPMNTW